MLSPLHLRMARAVLKWTFSEFTERTGIAKNSLIRFEAGGGINLSTATRIQAALAKEGIEFLYESLVQGPGILVSKELAHRLLGPEEPQPKKPAKRIPPARKRPRRRR